MAFIRFFIAFLALSASTSLMAGWTSSFSEEGRSYQKCGSKSALGGIQCSGGYCDNLSLYCRGSLPKVTKSWWTTSISEENRGGRDRENGITVRKNNFMQRCGTQGYIAGLSCKGAYCDNISLYCREYKNKKPRSCSWTSWVSEEHGGRLVFGGNKHAVAMQCKGGYCDNKKFLVCR